MTLISIIIPCYNHGKFLPDAVDSILKQTIQNFEVIIVNDASTDNTRSFCDRVEQMDQRVKVVHLKNNSGTAIANNVGMEQSVGEYITVMSADDMREKESFEKLYEACRNNPHKFAYDDMVLYVNGKKQDKIWIFPEYNFNVLLQKNTIHTGIMFERRAFIDTGGYPPEFSNGREDWAFNLQLGVCGYCGVHVRYPGYIYRREGQNRTLTNTNLTSQMKFAEMIRSRFSYLYAGRFPMGCCGQRNPVATKQEVSSIMTALVGSEGMTAVEYIGGNFGTVTYYGPITGTAYRFDAGDNNVKMVDNRDLHTSDLKGLLDLREHTKAIFVIASEQPPLPVAEEPVFVDEEVLDTKDIVDPSEGTAISTLVSETSVSYKKLTESGFSTVEQLADETVESLVEKTGISKTSAKALLGAI